MTDETGALAGIRVLDLGQLIQGPQCGQLLADLGADVIKIELPGRGDLARNVVISREDRRSPFFVACNRGKRGITLDLRMPAGRLLFLRLVASADVLISNFVPGTLEGWGLGYDTLAEHNPRLVFASGSTYGHTGPESELRGADLAGQAAGGLIRRTGPSDVRAIGAALADHLGSQNMTNGILAALYARQRTGRGQRVDVSLLGAVMYAQASEFTYTLLTGKDPDETGPGHSMVHGVYGIAATLDGHIAIIGVLPTQLAAFYATLGRPELLDDTRFKSRLDIPEAKLALFTELETTFRTRTTSAWVERLRAVDVRCAPVRDYLEITRDEGVYENGYLQRFEDDHSRQHVTVGCPIHLSDTPATPGRVAPEIGQHTDEVLRALGIEQADIARLRADAVI